MSDPKRKSSVMSGRNAALWLAVLPLATGIYQEGQQQRQRYAEREQARKTVEEQRLLSEAAIDEKTASALQEVVLQQDSNFCSRLYLAASLLKTQTVSERTRNVLVAALQLPGPAKRKPALCSCDLGEGPQRWLEDFIAKLPDDKSDSLGDFNKLARTAADRCEATQSPAPEPRVQALEQRIVALEAERDSLQRQLQPGKLQASPIVASASPTGHVPMPTCVIDRPGDRPRIRVFIQVANEASLIEATRLRAGLNAQGQFKSPQIENVGESRSPNQLQVRYAYPADEAAAQIVVNALASQAGCGRSGLAPQSIYMSRAQGKTDKGVIEVWWPRSAK